MIADPITLLQCCPNTDGAVALIMCSMDKARKYTSHPIKVEASVLQSADYTFIKDDVTSFSLGKKSAEKAYEMAGIGPEDLDLIELHDAFAPEEIVHYEDMGICKKGDGVELVRSGATAIGGKIPVNSSGGLLSLGHPLSASGVRNVCEVALHLRGQAKDRHRMLRPGLPRCWVEWQMAWKQGLAEFTFFPGDGYGQSCMENGFSEYNVSGVIGLAIFFSNIAVFIKSGTVDTQKVMILVNGRHFNTPPGSLSTEWQDGDEVSFSFPTMAGG